MDNRRRLAALLAAALLVGCAATPEQTEQARTAEEQVAAILSEPLDPAEYGETERCLEGHDYRNFRVLDDRRILFEGRRGQFWLNTLRMSCPDLRFANALRIRSTSISGRICDMDTFVPGDWFDLPWYRSWPWHWGSAWTTGARCSLGPFEPVTESQVQAIEAALRTRH